MRPGKILLTSLLTLGSFIAVHGQNQSQYDRGTPPQLVAGVSSLGSYTSTELGTVNLSNGGLNFNLPLGTIGGRGNVSIPLVLSYSSKVWSASMDVDTERESGTEQSVAYADYDNRSSFAGATTPGWALRAGVSLSSDFVRINRIMSGPSTGCYVYGLHKLTLNLPDRGEIEFRDDATDGAPLPLNCNTQQTTSRGTRWHATDGSGTIFLNDVDNGVGLFPIPNLSGTIIFADGTRLGSTTTGAIVDRNGNQITRSVDGFVDQLGRNITIQYGVTDPDNQSVTLAALITIPGYQGTARYYKIKTGIMNQNYRSGINPTLPVITGDWDPEGWGYNWGTATRLFAKSYGLYAQQIDDREVLTELVLPDGSSLKFRYNEFGEVAEVELPTGAKIQYDYGYASDLPSGNSPTWETGTNGAGSGIVSDVKFLDRAVKVKRTYPDGVNLEGTWTFGYSQHTIGATTYPATTVTVNSSASVLLAKQRHLFLQAGRHTEPYSGQSAHDGTYYTLWSTGLEWRTETLDAADNVLAATEQDWTQRAPVTWSTYPQEQPAKDNRVNQARRYLETGLMAKVETFYDQYNNPVEVKEYAFDQTLKRRTVTSYVSTNNGFNYQTDDSIHLLSLPETQTVYDGNGNQKAKTITEYDVYLNDGNHGELTSYTSVSQHQASYGASKTTRGNPTRIGTWLNTTDAYIYTYPRYDILGNVVALKDARGNVSTISFADDFGDGSNPGTPAQNPATPTYALPTLLTSPPPAAGAPVHTARSQYDYASGLLTGFRDRNDVITQTIYNDAFNRPTQVIAALGISGVQSRSLMYYAPAVTPFGITLAKNDVLTASDQAAFGDSELRSWTVTDGFGRTQESWSRDPQGDVKVVTIYDALGRTKQVSNPFRPALGEAATYSTTAYDLLGRVTTVSTPDAATVTTSYSGNTVTVTDQAGKARKSVTDALGRLSEVYEDPAGFNYQTTYTYDALDNLVEVQQGSQQRFFMYDSLKRLIRADNPEQETLSALNLTDPVTNHSNWAVKYEYDDNGNLTSKTDARGVVTQNSYDALNRLTTVLYRINGQPDPNTGDIQYLYDNAVYGKGRLWLTYRWGTKPSHTAVGQYDAMGRVKQLWNLFGDGQGGWSAGYEVSRDYNLAGAVRSQTYPSGHTVNYLYDTAGRTSSFTGNLGDGLTRTYASSFIYNARSQVTQELFGTEISLYHKLQYNIRGQLWDVRVSTNPDVNGSMNRGGFQYFYDSSLGYGTSGPDNNGNVLFANTYTPEDEQDTKWAIHRQRYNYDSLNRLKSVTEYFVNYSHPQSQQYVQTYDYDQWGNRVINTAQTSGTGINNKAFEVETARNRLYSPGDLVLPESQRRIAYDKTGNQIKDTYTGYGIATFDGDNRIVAIQDKFAGSTTYTYNANSQRVRRRINNEETWQIYGIDGELVAEYAANSPVGTPQKEYGYRNGQLLVTAEPVANVASAANGATVTASSTLSPYVAANVIDGSRRAVNSTVWLDNTFNSFPDWLEISFNSSQTISEIDVITQQDDPQNPVEPTLSQTFSLYGITAFEVQYWNGSAWTTVPGGGVTGNNKVWRQFTFAPITTNKIRVVVNSGADNAFSRVVEVEAWANGSSGSPSNIHWLVPDHLGTPRIILDQKGSLANIKRHDYLPFGEELVAGTGGRTTAMGYAAGDGVRQQFTAKERDAETGLDYFGARYYGNVQGRFTSVDPLEIAFEPSRAKFIAYISDPQNWNRYSYVLNNPVSLTDPDGREPNKTQAATVQQIVAIVEQTERDNPNATRAEILQRVDGFFRSQQQGRGQWRYVYTEEVGWIDFRHFFAAGNQAATVGEVVTNALGLGVEIYQSATGDESGFSYEDLGSNAAGADFADDHFDPNGPALSQQVAVYLNGLKPTLPTAAPNYANIPNEPSSGSRPNQSIHSRTTDSSTRSGQPGPPSSGRGPTNAPRSSGSPQTPQTPSSSGSRKKPEDR
jgi:RHS repeat-associated protein